MRKAEIALFGAIIGLLLAGCGGAPSEAPPTASPTPEAPRIEAADAITPSAQEGETMLHMKIDGTAVTVDWEDNQSVLALRELCREVPLSVSMSGYGGFEQVGQLGTSLPRDDVQTVTGPGDIVLYAGNQLVVFYGSNAWAYTRLGHISDPGADALAELLGRGDVTIEFYLE